MNKNVYSALGNIKRAIALHDKPVMVARRNAGDARRESSIRKPRRRTDRGYKVNPPGSKAARGMRRHAG